MPVSLPLFCSVIKMSFHYLQSEKSYCGKTNFIIIWTEWICSLGVLYWVMDALWPGAKLVWPQNCTTPVLCPTTRTRSPRCTSGPSNTELLADGVRLRGPVKGGGDAGFIPVLHYNGVVIYPFSCMFNQWFLLFFTMPTQNSKAYQPQVVLLMKNGTHVITLGYGVKDLCNISQ